MKYKLKLRHQSGRWCLSLCFSSSPPFPYYKLPLLLSPISKTPQMPAPRVTSIWFLNHAMRAILCFFFLLLCWSHLGRSSPYFLCLWAALISCSTKSIDIRISSHNFDINLPTGAHHVSATPLTSDRTLYFNTTKSIRLSRSQSRDQEQPQPGFRSYPYT